MANEPIDTAEIERLRSLRRLGCRCRISGDGFIDHCKWHITCDTALPALLDALENTMQERDSLKAAHADLKSENTALKVQVDALMQTIEENENAHDKEVGKMPNEPIDATAIERLQRFVASCRAQPPRPIPDCVPIKLNFDDFDKSHASLGDIAILLDALEAVTKEREAARMALLTCNTAIMEWGHGNPERRGKWL